MDKVEIPVYIITGEGYAWYGRESGWQYPSYMQELEVQHPSIFLKRRNAEDLIKKNSRKFKAYQSPWHSAVVQECILKLNNVK